MMSHSAALTTDIRFRPITKTHSKSNTAIGYSDPDLRVRFEGGISNVKKALADQQQASG